MIAITTSSSTNVKPQIERDRYDCGPPRNVGFRLGGTHMPKSPVQIWTISDGSMAIGTRRSWLRLGTGTRPPARATEPAATYPTSISTNRPLVGTAKYSDGPQSLQQALLRHRTPRDGHSFRSSFVAVQFEHNAITWWNCHGHSRSIPIKGEILDIAGSRKDLSEGFAVRQWQLPAIFCVAAIQADQQRLAVVAAAECKEFRPTVGFNKLDRPATQC